MRRRVPLTLACALVLFRMHTPLAGQTLIGAGATFPLPLYQRWFAAFAEKQPPFRVDYQAIGSEAGVDLLSARQVDFAASDAPLADAKLAAMPMKVFHIPTVVGGVVPIYHIEGVVQDLRFTPEVLAGIYLGEITRWDDPRIKAANRSVRLPSRAIAVVHRSDGSGTTYVWTSYLSQVSADWQASVGPGTAVKWPVGTGAARNDGVADAVRSTPDSIGYVEYIYALQAHLSYGLVRNASGRFVEASLASLPLAAVETHSGDFRVSLSNAAAPGAYPIASYTYFLIPEKFSSPEKAEAMTRFLRWALTAGQKQCAALGYAPLPEPVAKRALDSLGAIH